MRVRCLLVAAAALLFNVSGTAASVPADTYAYEALLDIDNNDATGCDVDAEDDNFTGPVPGVEYVVHAIIRRHPTSAEVDDVVLLQCIAGDLQFQGVVDMGDWQAGLENGINGADIVEWRVPLASIGDPEAINLGFHTTRAFLNDVLLTTTGDPNGEDIIFEVPRTRAFP